MQPPQKSGGVERLSVRGRKDEGEEGKGIPFPRREEGKEGRGLFF